MNPRLISFDVDVFQSFDRLCHFEVGVFLSKAFINVSLTPSS